MDTATHVTYRRLILVLAATMLVWVPAATSAGNARADYAQQGSKRTVNDGIGRPTLGTSAALSADVRTAIVGGIFDGQRGSEGAAWVFTRIGANWAVERKLPRPHDAKDDALFGSSAALAADGRTAVIGGEQNDKQRGAAWIYTRTPSTWTSTKVTGPTGRAYFGRSAALSADGKTALIGAPLADGDKGQAWVFTRSAANAWVGEKLKPTGESGKGLFGTAVAVSADGKTAVVGGPEDDNRKGAAWIFTRTGATWAQQGPKLTGSGEIGKARLGEGVSLSTSGRTAVVGGPYDDAETGAVWVFTRSGRSAWIQDGPKLVPNDPTAAHAGQSVALTATPNTILVGGPKSDGGRGAAWVLARSGAGWAQQGPRLTPADETGNGEFGHSLALSPSGDTVIAGAPLDNGRAGATWVFVSRPVVKDVSPRTAPAAGGTSVVITGSNLLGANEVRFGSSKAASFKVVSPTRIDAVTPAGAPGSVDVTVTTADSVSAVSAGDRFTYIARPSVTNVTPGAGPTTGGTRITVTGTALTRASAVRFGTAAAASFLVESPTKISAVSPPGKEGSIDVTVTTDGGTSPTIEGDRFTYTREAVADTKAPSPPGNLRGRFVLRTLVLRWNPARDDVGVHRYVLLRNGKVMRSIAGSATSTRVHRFRALRRTVFRLRAVDKAGNRSALSNAVAVVPRPRPAGVPRTIPGWARRLYRWETTGRHGKRPAAPTSRPAWYPRWAAWQLAPYRITKSL